MNSDLRATASDLLEALMEFSADALWMRTIPAYHPDKEPYAGPIAEVVQLQSYYLPHHQLPLPGQAFWRDVQGMIDLRFCDPYPDHLQAAETLGFHKALDIFRDWLVTTYQLAVEIPEKGKPKAPSDGTHRPSRDETWDRIKVLIFERHNTDNEHAKTAYTQTELGELVCRSQKFIHTLFAEKGPGEGLTWGQYTDQFKSTLPAGEVWVSDRSSSGKPKYNRELEGTDPGPRPGEDTDE